MSAIIHYMTRFLWADYPILPNQSKDTANVTFPAFFTDGRTDWFIILFTDKAVSLGCK